MLIKTKPVLHVYKVQGSIAVLIEEKMWEIMLKGGRILVMEPDPERWTLFLNGEPLHTAKAATAEKAVEGWQQRYPAFALDCLILAQDMETSAKWKMRPGFPNYLSCDRKKRREHERAGRDTAKKIADYYRSMVAAGIKGSVVAEELERFGTVKEGRD